MKSQKQSEILNISNKAQLTMFIILGIVIIAVFGMVFFQTGQLQRAQSQQQIEKMLSDILQTTPLRFYVTQCTEKALNNGIDLIGKQGGRIFPSQMGSLMKDNQKSFIYTEKDKTYFIAYGIFKNNIPLPQYPCIPGLDYFDKEPAYCRYASSNIIFNGLELGTVNLPSLCKNRFAGCNLDEGYSSKFSVQSQLESYVSAYVKECVDFESIAGINATFNITEGDVSANISFSDKGITAVVNFPIIVAPIGRQPVTKLFSFESTVPTRFKLMYGFARTAAIRDVVSPGAATSNIISAFLDIASQRLGTGHGFTAMRLDDVALFDDMIQISDARSDSKNPTTLQFIVENRPPVLNYLDPFGPYGAEPPKGCDVYDIICLEKTKCTVTPVAFDTEEDSITFSYSGWLENYNETNIADETSPCPKITKTAKILPQTRWNKTDDFVKTGNASADVDAADIGPHVLNISVCDNQYCDYQLVRILVDDLLKISINKTNLYGTQTFSLEDPFTLTAQIKDIYNPGNYRFSWEIQDMSGTPFFTESTGVQKLELPQPSYTIKTISDQYKQRFQQIMAGQTYFIVGKVNPGEQGWVENITQVVPYACYPFRSSSPPFPYNTGDPFMGNHSCCTDSNTIAGKSTVCFSKKTYGSFLSFDLDKYNLEITQYPSPTYSGMTPITGSSSLTSWKQSTNPDIPTPSNANDIIERLFSRNCSGTRGNMCTGSISEIFSIKESCKDKSNSEVATCYGPPVDMLGAQEQDLPKSCIAYDKTTFEKLIGKRTDAICSSGPKCVTDSNSQNGFDEAKIANDKLAGKVQKYICNATCGPYGCNQTIPNLCYNCFEQQSCTGKKELSPKTPNTISISYFKGCSNTGSTYCNPDDFASITKSSKCENGKMIDYYCKPGSYADTNVLYVESQPINCTTTYEKAAIDSDGDDPYTKVQCQYYQPSECKNNYCNVYDNLISTQQEGIYYYSAQNKFVFREYVAADRDGTGIKESCVEVYYDFDNLPQQVCIDEGAAKYGFTWVNGKCCGDDYGEPASC